MTRALICVAIAVALIVESAIGFYNTDGPS